MSAVVALAALARLVESHDLRASTISLVRRADRPDCAAVVTVGGSAPVDDRRGAVAALDDLYGWAIALGEPVVVERGEGFSGSVRWDGDDWSVTVVARLAASLFDRLGEAAHPAGAVRSAAAERVTAAAGSPASPGSLRVVRS